MALDDTGTVLELSGMGVVPYSTRGAVQTIEPIEQAGAGQYRDVNGIMRNVGGTAFQKYRSTISCTDQRPFAIDGFWQGKVVTVSCIQEFSYPEGSDAAPQRTPVSGSEYTEAGWIHYRPQLTMMVTGFSAQTDEYGADVSWSMTLEEV